MKGRKPKDAAPLCSLAVCKTIQRVFLLHGFTTGSFKRFSIYRHRTALGGGTAVCGGAFAVLFGRGGVCFRVMASDERHITEVYCFVPQPAENAQEDAAQKKA